MGAGLGIVRELAAGGALRRVVVVALGTNGTVTASQVRALQRAVGPRRELVLVNTFGPQSWEAADNAVLAAAARRSPHVRLADWNQAIIGRPEFLWPDGIHPRPAGARLYARVVLTAIRAAPSSGRQPRC
jgi:lysophospholipase L1-like esterase